jgi:hypothetical protein
VPPSAFQHARRGPTVRFFAVATTVMAAGLAWTPAPATAPVVIETHVAVEVGAIVVEGGVSKPVGMPQSAEAGPEAPAHIRLSVPWRSGVADVRLDAVLESDGGDGDAVLRCTASTTVGGTPAVVATRPVSLGEEGSSLFDIYGDGTGRILLTLRAEKVERAVVRTYVHVGDPVRFLVGVERIDGDRAVPLETNELHTFVGQSVEYSFRRGQDASLESVRLTLLPIAVSGDLITLDAAVSGALPGPDGPTLLAHHERIAASRRATSAIAATAGTPPAGYRFQVTPDF